LATADARSQLYRNSAAESFHTPVKDAYQFVQACRCQTFRSNTRFPMTAFRRFEHEKADVVEWLMDLQRKQK
jgi:hypothetical protein